VSDLLPGLQEPVAGGRASPGDGRINARHGQIEKLLSGDDLCGFPGGGAPGSRRPLDALLLAFERLFKLLPEPKRQQFLVSIAKAS